MDVVSEMFSDIMLKVALLSAVLALSFFIVIQIFPLLYNALRQFRHIYGAGALLFMSMWIWAMAEAGAPLNHSEKERIRLSLSEGNHERCIISNILLGMGAVDSKNGECISLTDESKLQQTSSPALDTTPTPSSLWLEIVPQYPESIGISLAWSSGCLFSAVGLYYSPRLESNVWTRIDLRNDIACATNCEWTIVNSAIATNKMGFFKAKGFAPYDDCDLDGIATVREVTLGLDPEMADSDGDFILDGDELGFVEIFPENEFRWFDIPHFMNYIVGSSDSVNYGYVDVDLETPISINGVNYLSLHATLDGHVYLSPKYGVGPPAADWCDPAQNILFAYSSLAEGCLSVFGCNADMGARKSTWGSGLYFETITTNGIVYDVVEYRNVGLMENIDSEGPSLTYEVIFPHNEPNVVYVSYLMADSTVTSFEMPLGIQFDIAREYGVASRFYTLQGPTPMAGRTIKYRIGTCTNPLAPNLDDFGVPLGYPRISSFDADGDGLSDAVDHEPIFFNGKWHGQSEAWVQSSFTNATEILSVGYSEWVDARVGIDMTNGLYKFTIAVSEVSSEPACLTVGGYSVVVTDVGDYVFLLEKGVKYPISLSSVPPRVTYFCYDGSTAKERMVSIPSAIDESIYVDRITVTYLGDRFVDIVEPVDGQDGYVICSPWLSIAPPGEVNPSYPVMMHAAVFDIAESIQPSVVWECNGEILSRDEYFTLTDDVDIGDTTITVTARCRDSVLRAVVGIERHIKANTISLNGGGAIIVEDAYTNAPGEVISSSSTSAALDVSWSLAQAGTFRFSTDSKGVVLTNETGMVYTLPHTWKGVADEKGAMRFYLSSPDASGQSGSFTLTFTPESGGAVLTQTVSLQVVKIRVEAEALWPSNRVRHVFGIRERFKVLSSCQVSLGVDINSHAFVSGDIVTAPDKSGVFLVSVTVGVSEYFLRFNCIAPTALRGGNPRELNEYEWIQHHLPPFEIGEAGVAMHIDTWLEPTYVSFSNLRLFEGFAPTSNRTGWYLNYLLFPESNLEHGVAAGAGGLSNVDSVGITSYGNFTEGGDCVASWIGAHNSYENGSFQLIIPLKWFVEGSEITYSLPHNVQTTWVYSNGTMRIQKCGVDWERTLSGENYRIWY